MLKLSILIPVHSSHEQMFNELLSHLQKQISAICKENEVEILSEIDNGEITTGAKRNLLLSRAKGEYVVFPDADDWVEDYYIEEILKAIESGCDTIGMSGFITTNNQNKVNWRLSKDYQNMTINEGGQQVYLRKTNHIAVTKRELALKAGFPNKSNAEDRDYSEKLNPFLKTEFKIQPIMYHYRFTTTNKTYK